VVGSHGFLSVAWPLDFLSGNRVLILSRYLGHGHVEDTYWYLTALPQLLADAGKRIALISEHEDSRTGSVAAALFS
jgi:hypothetical protein